MQLKGKPAYSPSGKIYSPGVSTPPRTPKAKDKPH